MAYRLTEQNLREMEEQGYTLLENVFTVDEMNALIPILEADEAEMRARVAAEGGESGISRASEITFNDHIAERNEKVREFCLRPEFVSICTTLLGPDVDLYWNQTVFKYPEGHREFPWHQDDAYNPVEPSPYLTLWLALNDATPENGCVSMLPGSHKKGLIPHEPSPIGWTGHRADDPDQGVLVPVKAGSVACFWSTTMHKSGVNASQGVRKAYVLQYSKNPMRQLSDGTVFEGLIPLARS